jgi:GMP synthase (glutamine-hydrolysing)
MPRRFAAQFGHNDRVVELPPGGVDLARTELCPVQAYRIAGLPVWGCQFHVELDPRRMVERASIYRSGYLPDEDGIARLAAALRPSPEASTLFARFLELAAGVTA